MSAVKGSITATSSPIDEDRCGIGSSLDTARAQYYGPPFERKDTPTGLTNPIHNYVKEHEPSHFWSAALEWSPQLTTS